MAIFLKSSKFFPSIENILPLVWSKTMTSDPKAINPTILVLLSIFILLTSSSTADLTQSILDNLLVTEFPILGDTSITKISSWSSAYFSAFSPFLLFFFPLSKMKHGFYSLAGLCFPATSLCWTQNSQIHTSSLVAKNLALTSSATAPASASSSFFKASYSLEE